MANDYLPDLNQLSGLSAQQKTDTGSFIGGLKSQTGDFLNRYKGAIGGQETMSGMAGRLGDQLNLPTLQKNAASAQQAVYDLPGVYDGATRGFDVNANQLSRIVGQKTSELAPIAQRAQEQANTAQGNLNTLLGYGQADQNKQLLPYQAEQSLLPGLQSTSAGLFSGQQQNELTSLINKINAGVSLTQTEWNNANQLAVAKQNFENQKALNQQQYDLGAGGNDRRYITLSDGASLYDTTTGQVISQNQKDFKGTGGGGVNINAYRSGRWR